MFNITDFNLKSNPQETLKAWRKTLIDIFQDLGVFQYSYVPLITSDSDHFYDSSGLKFTVLNPSTSVNFRVKEV